LVWNETKYERGPPQAGCAIISPDIPQMTRDQREC
jgi:hypothetical protein